MCVWSVHMRNMCFFLFFLRSNQLALYSELLQNHKHMNFCEMQCQFTYFLNAFYLFLFPIFYFPIAPFSSSGILEHVWVCALWRGVIKIWRLFQCLFTQRCTMKCLTKRSLYLLFSLSSHCVDMERHCRKSLCICMVTCMDGHWPCVQYITLLSLLAALFISVISACWWFSYWEDSPLFPWLECPSFICFRGCWAETSVHWSKWQVFLTGCGILVIYAKTNQTSLLQERVWSQLKGIEFQPHRPQSNCSILDQDAKALHTR